MAEKSKFTPFGLIDKDKSFVRKRALKDRNLLDLLVAYGKMKKEDFSNLASNIEMVMTGQIDPESPEGIAIALQAASIAGTGGVATAPKAGMGTLGMFVGKRSHTFDRQAAELAEKMHKEGKSPEEILKATGTRRWKSGDKQEINDMVAEFNPDYWKVNRAVTDLKLPDVLFHPDLYNAYPKLKEVTVVPHNNLNSGEAGFNPSNNTVYISPYDALDGNISPILHEVQHWIQEFEGWPGGGSETNFSPKVLDTNFKKPGRNDKPYLSPYEQYERLIGETEARAVQLRKDLTTPERRSILPERHFTYMDTDVQIPLKDLNVEEYFNNLLDFDMSSLINPRKR